MNPSRTLTPLAFSGRLANFPLRPWQCTTNRRRDANGATARPTPRKMQRNYVPTKLRSQGKNRSLDGRFHRFYRLVIYLRQSPGVSHRKQACRPACHYPFDLAAYFSGISIPLAYNDAGFLAMRSAVYLALVLLPGACWSQVAAKKRVAVFDFENAAVQAAITSSYFQTHAPDIGKGVAELLVNKLVQDAEVTVLERTAIDKVLAEQNLTASDRADPAAAARLGRLLG